MPASARDVRHIPRTRTTRVRDLRTADLEAAVALHQITHGDDHHQQGGARCGNGQDQHTPTNERRPPTTRGRHVAPTPVSGDDDRIRASRSRFVTNILPAASDD
jgi:hypothetical protein